MTDAQMGLFDATTGANKGGASGNDDQSQGLASDAQGLASDAQGLASDDQSLAFDGLDGQAKTDPLPDPAKRRTLTTEVWGTGPDGAYHHTNETVYYVVKPDELPREHLPDAPCVCGGRRFIAKQGRLHYWRCLRCVPPCPGERVAVYDVPDGADGDPEAEDVLQLPRSALPQGRCHQCGAALFAADAGEKPYRWRCARCHPPGPDGGIVIYNVSEENDDTDDT